MTVCFYAVRMTQGIKQRGYLIWELEKADRKYLYRREIFIAWERQQRDGGSDENLALVKINTAWKFTCPLCCSTRISQDRKMLVAWGVDHATEVHQHSRSEACKCFLVKAVNNPPECIWMDLVFATTWWGDEI